MPTGIVGEFLDLKAETDADILAMQCGDFYEFFADDAELVADELDLTVSQKSSHGSSYPMAGVPLSELTPYVKALVERGYRVAVADQYETEDGHAREITRVVTPGTLLETADDDARYLAAIVREGDDADGPYGLALADVTTGRFLVTEVDDEGDLRAELYRFDPAEVLRDRASATTTDCSERSERTSRGRFPSSTRRRSRRDARNTRSASSSGGRPPTASASTRTGAARGGSRPRLRRGNRRRRVGIDHPSHGLRRRRPRRRRRPTQRNLELTETMRGDADGSLFETVDHTVTAAGGASSEVGSPRPRRDREELNRRLDAVEALASAALARDRLRDARRRVRSRTARGAGD